jgi:hypothetical protein
MRQLQGSTTVGRTQGGLQNLGIASTRAASVVSRAIQAAGMEYRRLGSTGLKVSTLGLGSWVTYDYQLGVQQAKEIMSAAFEAGINL